MAVFDMQTAALWGHVRHRLFAGLVNVLLPPQCLVCNAPIDQSGALCAACWRGIDFIEAPFCAVLGIPFPFGSEENMLSPAAIANPPLFTKARAVAHYDGPARALIHALKYYDRLDVAQHMGALMARCAAEILEDADLIVPVPLYSGRLWQRRYNQSAALAKSMSALRSIQLDTRILKRVRATRAQVGLSARQRRDNVSGAFAIDRRYGAGLKNRNVVLVDDVLTTGATVEACTKVLLKAGALRVDVVTFARVVDPEKLPI